MKLSVVILNWNNAADTVACARSLQSWTGTKPEVWVVDNASADGSADKIQRDCPAARLIRNGCQQFTLARIHRRMLARVVFVPHRKRHAP